MPRGRKNGGGGRKRKEPAGSLRGVSELEFEAEAGPEPVVEEEVRGDRGGAGGGCGDADDDECEGEGEGGGMMMFSQQPPEPSQPTQQAKKNELANLDKMNASTREKIVTDLSRLLLFKALQGEPIDRLRVVKEAVGDKSKDRIASAAFAEAEGRLRDVFGFALRRVPRYMEPNLPKKFHDRLYVVNRLDDIPNPEGHCRALHSVHADAAVDRGLLMLILAFAHCRGELRRGHRWISAEMLYRLLRGVDESIPDEPPVAGGKGRGSASTPGGGATPPPHRGRFRRVSEEDMEGPHAAPDVDSALERFVHGDYLLRERVTKIGPADSHASQTAHQTATTSGAVSAADEGATVEYAMGPRAALEVGRRQVVHFLAEVMDEAPDPTMLAEIEDEMEEEEEEEGEEESGGEEGVKAER